MASFDKRYLQQVLVGGVREPIQGPLVNSTGTKIKNYGVTYIAASTQEDYKIDFPRKGLRKTIIATVGSTRDLRLLQQTTAITYLGSTHSTVTFSSGTGVKTLNLIGVSTSQWVITSKSTGVTTSA